MPLPFDLPATSGGFAALTSGARSLGERAAEAAARALSTVLGRDVALRGRPVPGACVPRAACARVALDLAALPAAAVLEVEAGLVVALVDALAGGPGAATAATALTPVEEAALQLLALVALEGICSVPEVERVLAPRVACGGDDPVAALAVELDVSTGPLAGRARLLLPAVAVRALRGAPDLAGNGIRLPVSVRSGRTALSEAELAELAPGDVVLLEPPDGLPDVVVVPGGARAAGRCDDGVFHVEEVTMTDRHAQLPVALEVELARVELSLSEIARLEPGATLPLALDRRGIVTLRVGERAIARGELVDVDGAVGVRVLSVEVSP